MIYVTDIHDLFFASVTKPMGAQSIENPLFVSTKVATTDGRNAFLGGYSKIQLIQYVTRPAKEENCSRCPKRSSIPAEKSEMHPKYVRKFDGVRVVVRVGPDRKLKSIYNYNITSAHPHTEDTCDSTL